MTDVLDEPLSRAEAVHGLKALEPELRARGVRSLYLFGSLARDEAVAGSDVDVFVEFEPAARLGWDFGGAPDMMAERLQKRIDFTTRGALHPLLKSDIEREAIRIF